VRVTLAIADEDGRRQGAFTDRLPIRGRLDGDGGLPGERPGPVLAGWPGGLPVARSLPHPQRFEVAQPTRLSRSSLPRAPQTARPGQVGDPGRRLTGVTALGPSERAGGGVSRRLRLCRTRTGGVGETAIWIPDSTLPLSDLKLFPDHPPEGLLQGLSLLLDVLSERRVEMGLVVAAAGFLHLIAEPSDYFVIEANRDSRFTL